MAESDHDAQSKSKISTLATDVNKGTSVMSANSSTNKESIECLHESKPAPNLSINATIYEKIEEDPSAPSTPSLKSNAQERPARIETVFEKLSVVSEQSQPSEATIVSQPSKDEGTKKDKQPSVTEINNPKAPAEPNTNETWRESGSSGKLNKQRDLASSIFPAGCMGCKDTIKPEATSPRRFLDASEVTHDHAGHIDAIPRKRSSSAKLNRNPLTGAGIEDDVRKISSRKKGNARSIFSISSANFLFVPSPPMVFERNF